MRNGYIGSKLLLFIICWTTAASILLICIVLICSSFLDPVPNVTAVLLLTSSLLLFTLVLSVSLSLQLLKDILDVLTCVPLLLELLFNDYDNI